MRGPFFVCEEPLPISLRSSSERSCSWVGNDSDVVGVLSKRSRTNIGATAIAVESSQYSNEQQRDSSLRKALRDVRNYPTRTNMLRIADMLFYCSVSLSASCIFSDVI